MSKPRLTEAERARRLEAVAYARASIGLEGFTLSQADELHAKRFIAGDIELAAFVNPDLDRPATPCSDQQSKQSAQGVASAVSDRSSLARP